MHLYLSLYLITILWFVKFHVDFSICLFSEHCDFSMLGLLSRLTEHLQVRLDFYLVCARVERKERGNLTAFTKEWTTQQQQKRIGNHKLEEKQKLKKEQVEKERSSASEVRRAPTDSEVSRTDDPGPFAWRRVPEHIRKRTKRSVPTSKKRGRCFASNERDDRGSLRRLSRRRDSNQGHQHPLTTFSCNRQQWIDLLRPSKMIFRKRIPLPLNIPRRRINDKNNKQALKSPGYVSLKSLSIHHLYTNIYLLKLFYITVLQFYIRKYNKFIPVLFFAILYKI